MPIDAAAYHGWHGRLRSPVVSSFALVRVALLQVFRRKLYWMILALGLMQFLQYFAIIYGVTQLRLPERTQARLLRNFGFSPIPEENEENGYTMFMEKQGKVVMILLALAGSMLVGADFRQRVLPFYLSRRIDRWHYVLGKLLAISALIALLTTLPALILFVEYAVFSESLNYVWDQAWVVGAILIYSAIICAVSSILLVTTSAYLQRLAPIAVIWATVFLVMDPLSRVLVERRTFAPHWKLMDLWHNIHLVSRWLYGGKLPEDQRELVPWAAAILVGLCVAGLLALAPKVRAVEVVT